MSVVLSLLLLQATAVASPADDQAATPPDDAKIVCRMITATGSRLGGKRTCLSKKEWRRLDRQSEETTRYFQDNQSKRPPPGQ